MRCSIAVASWLAPAVLGASVLASQEPQQQGAAKDSAKKLATVSIAATPSGRDQTRGANAIGKTDLKERAAGSSALKAVEKLPGVNMQSSDPWGSYEWANSITIRGFETRQIGQTFDGLPLGDMSYGNFNGLGVGRAVDPENLAGASVAQGSGAIGTSSANNLGGVVQYASDAPRGSESFSLRQTIGAANTYRTTGRWDTGTRSLATRGRCSHRSRESLTRSRFQSRSRRTFAERLAPWLSVLLRVTPRRTSHLIQDVSLHPSKVVRRVRRGG
jgi:iron complex outermembrane recepter protein